MKMRSLKMNKAMMLYALWYGFAGEGESDADAVDWSTLFDPSSESEGEEEKESHEGAADAPPAPVENPPADAVPEPVLDETPVTEEPKKEVTPEKADEGKKEEETQKLPVEQPKVLSPEEQEAQMAQFQGELEGLYAISSVDADMLVSNPEKVLPKLAAQVHLNVMRQMAQLMAQYQQTLPSVVEETTKVAKKKEEAAVEFNSRWPGLADTPEGQQATLEAVRIVKARNPNASMKKVIEESGRIAYSILGKDVPAAPAPEQKQGGQKPKPHIPAASKSAGSVQTQQLSPEELFYASLAN